MEKPKEEKVQTFNIECYLPTHDLYRSVAKILELTHRELLEKMLKKEVKQLKAKELM